MSINEKIGFCERVLDHCIEQASKVKNNCTNVIDKHKISASLKIYGNIIRDVVAKNIDFESIKTLTNYDITVVNKIVKQVTWDKDIPRQIKTTLVSEIIREYNIAHSSNPDDISRNIKAAFPEYSTETRNKMCAKINTNLALLRKDFENRKNPPLLAKEHDPFLLHQKNHAKTQNNIERVEKKTIKATSFSSGQKATVIRSSFSLALGLKQRASK